MQRLRFLKWLKIRQNAELMNYYHGYGRYPAFNARKG
jgi:hypothetical protein